MNPFHALTDEQLAEWHRLTVRCERLESDLLESRKAVEAAQNFGIEERQKLRAEITRRGDHIAEITLREIHAVSALRSTYGALVETLTALRRLLAALAQCEVFGNDGKALEVLNKIRDEAQDAIRRYDIPFGADPIR